jgi:hypothetical protein
MNYQSSTSNSGPNIRQEEKLHFSFIFTALCKKASWQAPGSEDAKKLGRYYTDV